VLDGVMRVRRVGNIGYIRNIIFEDYLRSAMVAKRKILIIRQI